MVNLCNFSKSGEAVAVVLTDANPPPIGFLCVALEPTLESAL